MIGLLARKILGQIVTIVNQNIEAYAALRYICRSSVCRSGSYFHFYPRKEIEGWKISRGCAETITNFSWGNGHIAGPKPPAATAMAAAISLAIATATSFSTSLSPLAPADFVGRAGGSLGSRWGSGDG